MSESPTRSGQHATDWTLVREALEQAPCAVTWCAEDHRCSRCAAIDALARLECECGWKFLDRQEQRAGCPACATGISVDG